MSNLTLDDDKELIDYDYRGDTDDQHVNVNLCNSDSQTNHSLNSNVTGNANSTVESSLPKEGADDVSRCVSDNLSNVSSSKKSNKGNGVSSSNRSISVDSSSKKSVSSDISNNVEPLTRSNKPLKLRLFRKSPTTNESSNSKISHDIGFAEGCNKASINLKSLEIDSTKPVTEKTQSKGISKKISNGESFKEVSCTQSERFPKQDSNGKGLKLIVSKSNGVLVMKSNKGNNDHGCIGSPRISNEVSSRAKGFLDNSSSFTIPKKNKAHVTRKNSHNKISTNLNKSLTKSKGSLPSRGDIDLNHRNKEFVQMKLCHYYILLQLKVHPIFNSGNGRLKVLQCAHSQLPCMFTIKENKLFNCLKCNCSEFYHSSKNDDIVKFIHPSFLSKVIVTGKTATVNRNSVQGVLNLKLKDLLKVFASKLKHNYYQSSPKRPSSPSSFRTEVKNDDEKSKSIDVIDDTLLDFLDSEVEFSSPENLSPIGDSASFDVTTKSVPEDKDDNVDFQRRNVSKCQTLKSSSSSFVQKTTTTDITNDVDMNGHKHPNKREMHSKSKQNIFKDNYDRMNRKNHSTKYSTRRIKDSRVSNVHHFNKSQQFANHRSSHYEYPQIQNYSQPNYCGYKSHMHDMNNHFYCQKQEMFPLPYHHRFPPPIIPLPIPNHNHLPKEVSEVQNKVNTDISMISMNSSTELNLKSGKKYEINMKHLNVNGVWKVLEEIKKEHCVTIEKDQYYPVDNILTKLSESNHIEINGINYLMKDRNKEKECVKRNNNVSSNALSKKGRRRQDTPEFPKSIIPFNHKKSSSMFEVLVAKKLITEEYKRQYILYDVNYPSIPVKCQYMDISFREADRKDIENADLSNIEWLFTAGLAGHIRVDSSYVMKAKNKEKVVISIYDEDQLSYLQEKQKKKRFKSNLKFQKRNNKK